jgi:hypothetical protein
MANELKHTIDINGEIINVGDSVITGDPYKYGEVVAIYSDDIVEICCVTPEYHASIDRYSIFEWKVQKATIETNEMRVLREFVAEFSPFHQTLVQKMEYDELFEVVKDIVETHYEDL